MIYLLLLFTNEEQKQQFGRECAIVIMNVLQQILNKSWTKYYSVALL